MTCAGCKIERETKGNRLPLGWKRFDEEHVLCPKCWRERYVLRAVTIPVASPISLDWDAFNEVLRRMWIDITQASNWMLTQMYTRDAKRGATEKMPPMPRMYLYPEARQLFPQLPSQTVAALEQAIRGKYRAKRFEVIWTCSASLPTYRYPSPFPVHNQSWSVRIENDFPIISARVGEQRMEFRLRGGPRYRRQMMAVREMIGGSAFTGQMDLYRVGRGKDAEIMCKMVAWLPRKAAQMAEGTLHVRTDPESLIVALNAKDDKLWIYHGKQAPRWSAEHSKRLQQWADDSKAEQRPVPSFAERRRLAATKYRNRMASLTHQVSAMIVNLAKRRKFAAIRYDDTDHSFCEKLPWFTLRQKLAAKCNEAGIAFEVVASAGVEEKAGEPLASEEV